jgi:anti-anti-sigma regulatory factor
MTLRQRPVSVREIPPKMDAIQARKFLREIETCMSVDRPCIVLDCSRMREMSNPEIRLLLSCLEEAMKRNGDVRLAAVPFEARVVLERTAVDGLFKMFVTVPDAIDSFRRRAASTGAQLFMASSPIGASENAA